MKLRKFLAAMLAASVFAALSVTAFADDADYTIPPEWERPTVEDIDTNWQTANWIQVHDRDGNDYSGVQFELSTFVEEVDRADEGFYEWIFIVDAFGDALGCYYKVLTQDGPQKGAISNSEWGDVIEEYGVGSWDGDEFEMIYKRFTSWGDYEGNPIKDEAIMSTRFIDMDKDTANGTEERHIPAEYIMIAAEFEQRMRIQTQSDTRNYQIKEIIINHYLDGELGEPTRIYAMSEDPKIQDLQVGESFDGGSLGLIRSGSASFLISNADNLKPTPIDSGDNGAETNEPDEEEAPEDDAAPENEAPPEEAPVPEDDQEPASPAGGGAGAEEDEDGGFPIAIPIAGGAAVVVVGGAAAALSAKKKK